MGQKVTHFSPSSLWETFGSDEACARADEASHQKPPRHDREAETPWLTIPGVPVLFASTEHTKRTETDDVIEKIWGCRWKPAVTVKHCE